MASLGDEWHRVWAGSNATWRKGPHDLGAMAAQLRTTRSSPSPDTQHILLPEIKTIGSVLGLGRKKERLNALDQIE